MKKQEDPKKGTPVNSDQVPEPKDPRADIDLFKLPRTGHYIIGSGYVGEIGKDDYPGLL